VWIFLTRVNHGRMVAHCGLEPRHESRGVEVPLWMFDTAVCCQMRMAPVPVVNIEALHELAALLAAHLQPDGGPMLQAQHDSLLPEGGADASPTEPTPGDPTCVVSVDPGRTALGAAAMGSAATDGALAGADVERTRRAEVGSDIATGGQR
ncbi:MAG TPA: hypothetical protein VIM14_06585, partial [Polyangia bacterium]